MNKFKNKYRIPSARLQSWDYGNNGAYFITICTQNREHFFGEIVETQFIASEIGKLAETFWAEIPNHFPFIELGNFVVMPNHVHGILIIDKNDENENIAKIENIAKNVETRLIASLPSSSLPSPSLPSSSLPSPSLPSSSLPSPSLPSSSLPLPSLPSPSPSLPSSSLSSPSSSLSSPSLPSSPNRNGGFAGEKNPMFHENISRIIRWYKGRCTFEIRKIHADFAWQPRFHDHIIRNAESFERIQTYIENNPKKWKEDKFYEKQISSSSSS